MRGVDILLMIEGETNGTFIAVGGQRNATLSEEVETIDITSKDSQGYQEFDYGLGSWKIKGDGVYVPNEAAYVALRDKMRAKQPIKVRIHEKGTATEEGTALITSRELEAPYDGEVTYSMEFQGTGKLTTVTGA
jgi:TP901-1 family phage major tail protein